MKTSLICFFTGLLFLQPNLVRADDISVVINGKSYTCSGSGSSGGGGSGRIAHFYHENYCSGPRLFMIPETTDCSSLNHNTVYQAVSYRISGSDRCTQVGYVSTQGDACRNVQL